MSHKREGSWDELSSSPPQQVEPGDFDERRRSRSNSKGGGSPPSMVAPSTQYHAAVGVANSSSPLGFGGGSSEPSSSSSSPRSTTGAMAKPKFLKGSSFVEALTSNVTSTMSGWLTYLPASVSKNIPVVPEDSQKPKIVWSHFQRVKAKRVEGSQTANSEGILYLVLGYPDGFQVWDCSNIEEIREVLSVRDGSTRCAKFLEVPADEIGENTVAESRAADSYERFEESRPHLAVVASEPSQKVPMASVKIYSLKTNEVVHILRFKSEVHNIYSNARILVVCLHDNVFAFDSKTYKNAFGISGCQPNPHSGSSVVALGVRWLAYATSQPISRNQKQGNLAEQASFANHPVVGVAKEMATDLAQNLFHWGDKGFQAMANYFSGTADERSNPQSRSPPNRGSESPKAANNTEVSVEGGHGTIMIRDVTTRASIAHFQAHSSSLSAMSFNPNGSLLVTASSQGHEFCVFQILPNVTGDPTKSSHNLLYRLKRGVYTNAIIEDISFSLNSQWVAVSSARGTTHLFPINPFGGAPTVHTHAGERIEGGTSFSKAAQPEEALTIPALGRIHQPSLLNQHDESQAANMQALTLRSKKMAIASFFVPKLAPSLSAHEESLDQKQDMGFFLINPHGILSFHLLSPQVQKVPNKAGQEVKELKMQADELIEWNLVRGEQFGEVVGQFERITPQSGPRRKGAAQSKWLSNVEVTTHAPLERPIWMGPQFVFKTFQGGDTQDGEGEAVITSTYDEEMLAEDELPSRSLEFRTLAPVPYKEDPFDNDPGVSVYSMSPKELAQNLNDALEDNFEHGFSMAKPKVPESKREVRLDKSKDLDFEDDALVVGGPGSLPNSFKDDWDYDQGGSRKSQHHHQREYSGGGDEFENLAREAISPDGDNELGLPNGSVFLN